MLHNIRCNSYNLLKKGWVVFSMIFLPERQFWKWASPAFLCFLNRKASLILTSRKKFHNVKCNSQKLLKKGWMVLTWHIFANEAVLTMSIGPNFWGFLIEKQPKTWLCSLSDRFESHKPTIIRYQIISSCMIAAMFC